MELGRVGEADDGDLAGAEDGEEALFGQRVDDTGARRVPSPGQTYQSGEHGDVVPAQAPDDVRASVDAQGDGDPGGAHEAGGDGHAGQVLRTRPADIRCCHHGEKAVSRLRKRGIVKGARARAWSVFWSVRSRE